MLRIVSWEHLFFKLAGGWFDGGDWAMVGIVEIVGKKNGDYWIPTLWIYVKNQIIIWREPSVDIQLSVIEMSRNNEWENRREERNLTQSAEVRWKQMDKIFEGSSKWAEIMSERVGEKKGIWHSQRKLDENGWTRFARLGTATDSYYVEQNSYGFLLRRTENIIDVIYIFNRQKQIFSET